MMWEFDVEKYTEVPSGKYGMHADMQVVRQADRQTDGRVSG